MEICTFPCGPLDANCYLLSQKESPYCIVIDCGDAAPALDYLKEHDKRLLAILLTHGHFDHVLGVEKLHRSSGAEVYIGKGDAEALSSGVSSLARTFGYRIGSTPIDRELEGGEELTFLGEPMQVLASPGHTPGGVAYYFPQSGLLFSGDTLFCQGVGRADLPGGDLEALTQSVKRLLALPGDTVVYPGHDRTTTIARERGGQMEGE